MIDYGKQRSTVRPEPVELTETRAFVATDIQAVSDPAVDGQEGFTGWEFHLTEYTKDEYIRHLEEVTTSQAEELTSLQLALCEVYEMIGG